MGPPAASIVLICCVLGSLGLGPVDAAGSTPDAVRPASPHIAAPSLIRNGGFEDPAVTRPWVPFFANGTRHIPGWRVIRHSVDLVGTDWPAGRGNQSLGVNGFRRGWVSQFVSTEANTTYKLSFLLWGDPNGPPPRSQLAVRWDLERIRVRKVDVLTQPRWRRVTLLVQSTKAGTALGFRSLTPGNAGPAIDAVRLVPVR